MKQGMRPSRVLAALSIAVLMLLPIFSHQVIAPPNYSWNGTLQLQVNGSYNQAGYSATFGAAGTDTFGFDVSDQGSITGTGSGPFVFSISESYQYPGTSCVVPQTQLPFTEIDAITGTVTSGQATLIFAETSTTLAGSITATCTVTNPDGSTTMTSLPIPLPPSSGSGGTGSFTMALQDGATKTTPISVSASGVQVTGQSTMTLHGSGVVGNPIQLDPAGLQDIMTKECGGVGTCVRGGSFDSSGHARCSPISTADSSHDCLYVDSSGDCHIGYGYKLHPGACDPGTDAQYVNGITEDQAVALLNQELVGKVKAVNDNVKVSLSQKQYNALVDFAYNAGIGCKVGTPTTNCKCKSDTGAASEGCGLLGQLLSGDPAISFQGLNQCQGQTDNECYQKTALWLNAHYVTSDGQLDENLIARRCADATLFAPTPYTCLSKQTFGTRRVYTSSTISDFSVDPGNQQATFKVSGTAGTEGATVIPLTGILNAPYSVTLDGTTFTHFEALTDINGDKSNTLLLSYPHSTHSITITTAKVPPTPFQQFTTAILSAYNLIGGLPSVLAIIVVGVIASLLVHRRRSAKKP